MLNKRRQPKSDNHKSTAHINWTYWKIHVFFERIENLNTKMEKQFKYNVEMFFKWIGKLGKTYCHRRVINFVSIVVC